MEKKQLKVALVGYGMGGRVFHAPIIQSIPGLEISKILVNNQERAADARRTYPSAEIVGDLKSILQDDGIELVVVATPNESHYGVAKGGLMAGKNVVVDKPFTVSTSEADELIELAKKLGKIISVHHNRRYDSDFLTVKKIIEKGFLGELVEYESHFDRFRNSVRDRWKESDMPGSGNLYDLGSHLIDQALCLFGLPKEVTADIRKQRTGAHIDDNFELILNYGRLKVTLKAGMLVREELPSFILHGQNGSFVKYGMDVQEGSLANGMTPDGLEDWGKEPESMWGTLNTDIEGIHFRGKVESEVGDYRLFYKNVYDAITGQAELFVTPEQARNVIRVIELAKESSENKRTVAFTQGIA
jgi:predicted dehydrogenase